MAGITYREPPRPAVFLERVNRFVARVELDGREVSAHVPSSGRMKELLFPGAKVFLLSQPAPARKTPYDLVLARGERGLVSVDSRLPNLLLERALAEGDPVVFPGLRRFVREVRFGTSRFDFLLELAQEYCYLEVKSVTLVRDGQALFPDAPTTRGTRHLYELIEARRQGWGAAVLFLIQREDARAFSPNGARDPDFSRAVGEAARAGVIIRAFDCNVNLRGVFWRREVPVAIPEKNR